MSEDVKLEMDRMAGNVAAAVTELHNGVELLVRGMERLKEHETSPQSHGLDASDSPIRVAIDHAVEASVNTIVDERIDARMPDAMHPEQIENMIVEKLPDVLPTMLDDDKLSAMIDEKLPDVLGEHQIGDIVRKHLPELFHAEVESQNSDLNLRIAEAVDARVDNDVKINATIKSVNDTANNAQSSANAAKTTAESAQTTANTAKTTAETAQSTATTAKSTADAAKTAATNAQTTANTAKTTAESAQTTANACVPKSGSRGNLAGSETASAVSGSQTINANSADCVNIATSGAVTLTFTPGAATIRAVKAICLTASAATTLVISGAVWANNGSAPTWGDAGKILVILAHFVGGRVVLSVADNTQ